jgi:hypothetical protein
MRILHGALVAMQDWVKASRAKICVGERLLPLLRPMFRSARRVVLIPERGRTVVSAAAQAPGAVAGQ